ncbi:MAG TPA: adenylate/guanylate cyclase domain-containing protein [Vicinamibacterales bacterium]|nr:adenylate/guanylate cyclase domain-containing protein [Vicinamibacterales bacterium]
MKRILVALALGAVSTAIAWLAGRLPLAASFENSTFDARLAATAPPASPQSPIVIVEINDTTLQALEPTFGRWPWPRVVHSGVIDYLARAGARVIAYDVLFIERDTRGDFAVGSSRMSGADSDGALVASVRRAGNVVLAADASSEELVKASQTAAVQGPPDLPGAMARPGQGFQPRPVLKLPFEDLARAALAIGHTAQVIDPGGSARRQWPFIEYRGVAVPSLGLAAAIAADRVPLDAVRLEGADALRVGERMMPLLTDPAPPDPPGTARQPSKQALLSFRHPVSMPDGTIRMFPVYSFFDVLLSEDRASSGQTPPIDPAAFKDKIVFVGTSAAGLNDVFTTPFGGGGLPGVELHATLADSLLSGRFIGRASAGSDLLLTGVVGLAAGFAATFLPAGWATLAVAAVAALVGAWLTRAVGHGVWHAAVVPASATALALFGGVAWQYFVEGRAKRQVKQLFGRYVSPAVIDQLMADPSLARLGGDRREMTVLFSDIRGFTAASERGAPEAVVAQLNEYFGVMVEVLFRHQGTLDKFVGDMVMGLFGAPVADPRHADHAVDTALEMSAALDRLNAAWQAQGRPVLEIGIGINSGEMIAGNIGSSAIMSYTVIGDAVNLGSRIESLNKDYGTRILISQATKDRLTTPVATRLVGSVTVKGRTQPVVVYEVVRSTS